MRVPEVLSSGSRVEGGVEQGRAVYPMGRGKKRESAEVFAGRIHVNEVILFVWGVGWILFR